MEFSHKSYLIQITLLGKNPHNYHAGYITVYYMLNFVQELEVNIILSQIMNDTTQTTDNILLLHKYISNLKEYHFSSIDQNVTNSILSELNRLEISYPKR